MRFFAFSASTVVTGALLWTSPSLAADSTLPGEISAPHPTLENVSLRWDISGDDNANGVVTVRFRERGQSAWRSGLPLRRIPAASNEGFSWDNQHSGSVFDLIPGTTYEFELSLVDPDGGDEVRSIEVTTRDIPSASADATEIAVTPSSIRAALSSITAGDVLVLGDGTYAGLQLERDGTVERPIVVRAANRGRAIIDSEVSLIGRSNVFLEGLTINGRVRLNDTRGMVVRDCTINTSGSGIVAQGSGTRDSYICDNRVVGATSFEDGALGADGDNVGEGIEVTGPGTVICYNYVSGFRDAISTMEDSEAVEQVSIDIYNNDIDVGADDAIEVDFTMGNVRVMRNRIRNSFVGLSGQPTLGGPLYLIRNVMHNVVYSPFKLHRGSVGDVALHNTVVKSGDAFACYAGVTWSQAYFRNNLFIGGEGGGSYGGYSNGDGRVAQLVDADDTCDFDFDGYGSIGTGRFTGRIGDARFDGLDELRTTTTEAHAVEVDMTVFSADVTFPVDGPFPPVMVEDLRIADGSAAADTGTPLANVNDGFAGDAPDLGAYEAGTALPHYGPRWDGVASECGNGVREDSEQCDDGNRVGGDGCSASCEREEARVGDHADDELADAGIDGGNGNVQSQQPPSRPSVPDGNDSRGTGQGATGADASTDPIANADAGAVSGAGPDGDRESSSHGGCECGTAPWSGDTAPPWSMLGVLGGLLVVRRYGSSQHGRNSVAMSREARGVKDT